MSDDGRYTEKSWQSKLHNRRVKVYLTKTGKVDMRFIRLIGDQVRTTDLSLSMNAAVTLRNLLNVVLDEWMQQQIELNEKDQGDPSLKQKGNEHE